MHYKVKQHKQNKSNQRNNQILIIMTSIKPNIYSTYNKPKHEDYAA